MIVPAISLHVPLPNARRLLVVSAGFKTQRIRHRLLTSNTTLSVVSVKMQLMQLLPGRRLLVLVVQSLHCSHAKGNNQSSTHTALTQTLKYG